MIPRRALLACALFLGATTSTQAQQSPFVGEWTMRWDGPNDRCPCKGTLSIRTDRSGNGHPLIGDWVGPNSVGTLRGTVNLNQNFWGGSFTMDDDGSPYPQKGFFRLELRGLNTLTGSYRRDGTAMSYSWSGERE